MSAVPPASEYRRNFSWKLSDGYTRSCPSEQYKPTNILYRPNSLDFINASSKIDHKTIAKQYMKLNPQLNASCNRDETKSDYEFNLSTYKDTFRKNAKHPSMTDYIKIANNVTDDHFPDSVKYFYDPEEFEESNNSSKNASSLKTVNVRFPKSTDRILKDEDEENNKMVPKKSMDPSLPPKITDLGAFCYRNDVSLEIMPKHDSLQEYIEETQKRIKNAVIRNEYEQTAIKKPERKLKRYIDLRVY
ncbi:unnamed protein product [Nezara viridula]|uniref:Uncharacterized protein n=1 Tax=Nezara viridula TaxID=85310 RepID=A0A9P0E309_NEZVI|nr:unnamed protein product [Nezara viridula]